MTARGVPPTPLPTGKNKFSQFFFPKILSEIFSGEQGGGSLRRVVDGEEGGEGDPREGDGMGTLICNVIPPCHPPTGPWVRAQWPPIGPDIWWQNLELQACPLIGPNI